MPAPTRLQFSVGDAEKHEVVAELSGEDRIAIAVDGIVRVSVRAPAMLGGYAFDVGDVERHRVEIFHVAGEPPGIEAKVDGVPVVALPRPAAAPHVLAAGAVGLVGAAWLALGAIGVARGAGAIPALGFGKSSIALGAALLWLTPLLWRRARWAGALAAALFFGESAWAAHGLARDAGNFWAGFFALRGLILAALVFAAFVLGRERRWRPPPRVKIPASGEIVGRCGVHGEHARIVCTRCRRALCAFCAAYRRRNQVLCGPCAGVA
jgi:hypothetical protein